MYFKINIANKIRSYTYPIQLILQSWKVILINLGKLISPVDHHRCKYIRTSCPGTVGWHCHLVVIFCCSHCPLHAYWGDVEGIWVSLGTYYVITHFTTHWIIKSLREEPCFLHFFLYCTQYLLMLKWKHILDSPS